jgi:hypothetical protein
MAWGFRKRKRVAPGVDLNLGKHGFGLSFGRRGMRLSVGSRGRRRLSLSRRGAFWRRKL